MEKTMCSLEIAQGIPEILKRMLDLSETARILGSAYYQHFVNPGRISEGGAVCYMHYSGQVLLLTHIGKPSSEKFAKSSTEAFTMCEAILETKYDRDVVSSWSVRNPDAAKPVFGGGIKLSNGDFLSVRAFTEALDETMVLQLGEMYNLLDSVRTREILEVSGHTGQPGVNRWLDNIHFDVRS